jgi:hypothetical protein
MTVEQPNRVKESVAINHAGMPGNQKRGPVLHQTIDKLAGPLSRPQSLMPKITIAGAPTTTVFHPLMHPTRDLSLAPFAPCAL